MKNSNKYLVISFLIIIYLVLLFYPINYILVSKGIIKIYNPQASQVSDGKGISAKIENIRNNLESKTINYFPLYNKINYIDSKFYIKSNSYLYNVLKKDFLPVGTNYDNEYIYKNINDNFYILKSEYNEDELNKRIDSQIKLYNYLSSSNVDMYIYLPNRYEFDNSTYLDINNMNKYIAYFKDNLNSKIKVGELNQSKGYHNYFYKTDHHWNGYGALQGYQDIMTMMGIKYNSYEVKKMPDVTFRGSMAKSAADPSLTDNFYYIDANISCETSIKDNYKPMQELTNKDLFYDYYVGYYYGMYGEVYYDCLNSKKDNILILGDSYTWSMDFLIANHFNKTYIVNLRFLDHFDYKDFIIKNNIKKVIVLNETQTTLFDAYNHYPEKKVGM